MLQVKCEEHVDALAPRLFDFFLSNPSICELRMVQYMAPLEWITDAKLMAAARTSLVNSEMLIMSNTSSSKMALSMETVEALIESAPNLSVLGNLVRLPFSIPSILLKGLFLVSLINFQRTWSNIDHYDSNSDHFYKSESQLSQLKQEAMRRNWDISLDLEDIDFLRK